MTADLWVRQKRFDEVKRERDEARAEIERSGRVYERRLATAQAEIRRMGAEIEQLRGELQQALEDVMTYRGEATADRAEIERLQAIPGNGGSI